MDRHDSKKTRNSVMGRLKQNQQSDNDSDDQHCVFPDVDLVNDFRDTLSTLNSQFTSLEHEYRKVVRENHDLRRQITKLEARVKIHENVKKSKKNLKSRFLRLSA
jgi:regulator of replication initiation timing